MCSSLGEKCSDRYNVRTQHRTAVTAHFLLRTLCCEIYLLVAFTASLRYYLAARTYGNRRIVCQCGGPFFSATASGVVGHLFQQNKKPLFFRDKAHMGTGGVEVGVS